MVIAGQLVRTPCFSTNAFLKRSRMITGEARNKQRDFHCPSEVSQPQSIKIARLLQDFATIAQASAPIVNFRDRRAASGQFPPPGPADLERHADAKLGGKRNSYRGPRTEEISECAAGNTQRVQIGQGRSCGAGGIGAVRRDISALRLRGRYWQK